VFPFDVLGERVDNDPLIEGATTMRYMLIMHTTEDAVEESEQIPFEQIFESMGRYNESMTKAGVLLAAEGLTGPDEGLVVDFSGDPPMVTDGPYGETKELFHGFWVIEVSSKEEAAEWAKRAPLSAGSYLEVRRIGELEDLPISPDNEWAQKALRQRDELTGRAART